MSDAFLGIGFAVLSAAFGLIWWEVRQLRRSKHDNAQLLQWVVMSIAILAKKAEVDLPRPLLEK